MVLEADADYVHLCRACFANKRYEDASAVKCFSNLLAVGFQRFEIDLFWDVSRGIWSLCPVELGGMNSNANVTNRAIATTSQTSLRSVASEKEALDRQNQLSPRQEHHLTKRQPSSLTRSLTVPSTKTQLSRIGLATSASTTKTLSSTGLPSTNSTTGIGHSSTTTPPAAGTVFDVGPYSCTSSINLELLTQVMVSHLDSTQTNVNATLKYFILNLHAAAPASSPNGSPVKPTSEDLPKGSSMLSSVFYSAMPQYLYTPKDLQTERSDLNSSASWFDVNYFNEPDPSYFHVHDHGDHTSTPDGWPSTSYVEMERAKRLFAGFGLVESQMENYNFSGDAPTIFPQHYLESSPSVTANAAGHIRDGCFFNAKKTSVSSTNNSWAFAVDGSTLPKSSTSVQTELIEASNLTYCGISPVLNDTLGDKTAGEAYEPYRDFVQSTIWSWGPGQPRDDTPPDDDDPKTENRCAVLDAKSGYWQTADCAESHFSACRSYGQPYGWSISSDDTSYTNAAITCDDGTEFTTPRTALEDTYLLHKWRETIAERNIGNDLLWVNVNDLNAKGCWVVGQNTTCPYLPNMGNERTVIVPTVAAVIVFVLAVLTVFVKCAANRQRSKRRRRRGDDGWDYEGVPS